MANYSEIMKSLNICVTLYHAYETLIRCGLRAFLNFYEEHINNPLLSGNVNLRHILEDLREYLGPNAEVRSLPDGTFTKVPTSTKFGHPKLHKLRDILLTHFKNGEPSTRVIVFFEYRESASEAYALLSQSYPMIKSRVFVGQGSGSTQKDQINTIRAFREGGCNTLLSTSIGEEGLDVGDVDLIVCFDIANRSPIRMIQRMGRTGRKKEGRVVVLVTEGREQQTLKECLIYKNNLGSFVSNSEQLEGGKYADNPKMIPSYIQPKCQKMFITVKKPLIAKNNNIRDMLKKAASTGLKFCDDLEIVEVQERIKNKVENLWDKELPLQFSFEQPKINFRKYLEKQRGFQATGSIKPSKQTDIFVSLLQFADSKRYNLPITQQISQLGDFSQNKILKQGDIRTMFAKPQPFTLSQETLMPNTQQHNYEKEKDITQSFPAELFDEMFAFLSINSSKKQGCKTCDLLFECPKVDFREPEKLNLRSWVLPDLSILDNVSAQDFEVFADSLTPESKEIYQDFLEGDSKFFEDITFTEAPSMTEKKNTTLTYETPRNFDKILKSFRIDENVDETPENVVEKPFAYETPKNFGKVLNILGDSLLEEFKNDLFSKNEETQRRNLGAIGADPEKSEEIDLVSLYTDVLAFFKLETFDDIFENEDLSKSLDETIIYTPEILGQRSPEPQSPDLFETSPDLFPSSDEKCCTPVVHEESGSPILCSYERVQQLKAKKKLFDQSKNEDTPKKPRLSNLMIKRKSFYETSRSRSEMKKQEKDKTDELDVGHIGDGQRRDKTKIEVPGNEKDDSRIEKNNLAPMDLSEICDFSSFLGSDAMQLIDNKRKDNKEVVTKEKTDDDDGFKRPANNFSAVSDINDVCDFDSFLGSNTTEIDQKGNDEADIFKKEERKGRCIDVNYQWSNRENSDRTKEIGKRKDQRTLSRTDETDELDISDSKNDSSAVLDINDVCDFSSFLGSNTKISKKRKNDAEAFQKEEREDCAEDVNDQLLSSENCDKTKEFGKIKEDKQKLSKADDDLDISDLCDLSVFGLSNSSTNKMKDKNDNKLNTKRAIETRTKNTNGQQNNGVLLKANPTKELAIEDLCDMSDFFGEHFSENSVNKKTKEVVKDTKIDDKLSNVGFRDYITNDPQKEIRKNINLTKSPAKSKKSSSSQKTQKNVEIPSRPSTNKNIVEAVNSNVIDLTDSDLESSPIKPKQTQIGKNATQVSITQMLSLMGKVNGSNSSSQKENTFSPKTQKPKPGLSLSTKKGVLHLKQSQESPKKSQKKRSTSSTQKTNNINSAPKTNKKKWNISLAEDSDDEFEDTATFKSPVFAKPKAPVPETEKNKVDRTSDKPTCSKPVKKRKKILCEFIEQEAEVSEDERIVISDDEDSGEDCFEASFVTDETQDCLNTTNMQVKYLESVKSPMRRGLFKIPQKFRHNISNVYSQEVSNVDNTYMNDTFCVGDADEVISQRHDLSELEILEQKLKEKKKRKKSEDGVIKKRRRIIMSSDSD